MILHLTARMTGKATRWHLDCAIGRLPQLHHQVRRVLLQQRLHLRLVEALQQRHPRLNVVWEWVCFRELIRSKSDERADMLILDWGAG